MATRFLLAQLHLDSLIGKRSPKALRATLSRLPSGTEAYGRAYEDAMIRIESQVADQAELAKQALSWITCAKRPLTTTELLRALAIEAETSEFDTDSIPQREDVVSSCAGLVTVDEESDIIRLVHYTAQEYFERTKDEWFPNMEIDVASACVTYLSYSCFGGMHLAGHYEFNDLHDEWPLYEYACCNWGHHVREARLCTPEIVGFLTSPTGNAQASARTLLLDHTDGRRYWLRIWKADVSRWITGRHLAAYFGAKEALSALVSDSSSVDPLDPCSRTPLSWAAENGYTETVTLLLSLGANADSKDTGGQTPLSWACKRGHDEVVRLLLRQGADPNSRSESGRTPLSKAAANGHVSIVQLLLAEAKVQVDSKDEDLRTPLLRAVQNGHAGVVRLLCGAGADVNSPDFNGQTPLIRTSRRDGDDECVRLLLDHGADPKHRDHQGATALHGSVFSGNLGITKLLLQLGVDPDIEDCFGMTPLCWAARGGQREAIALLLDTCGDRIGDKSRGRYKTYLLEWAIQFFNSDMVEELLEQGVDLTVQDYHGETPLHLSCWYGSTALSRRLLDMGADIEATETNGYTPLALVVSNGANTKDIESIALLLERGADIETRDIQGRTPFFLAVEINNIGLVKLLLDNGADIDARSQTGQTPLGRAIMCHQNDMCELLLERGVDIDARDKFGHTALLLAAMHCAGRTIIERIIKERPSLINAVDDEGRSPLWWAIESGSPEVVDLMLRNGAGLGKSINDKDTCGTTAFMMGVRWGHIDVVKLLLQHTEVDPDLGDYYGTTPLSVAARIGPSQHSLELVKLLLGTGRVTSASKDCFGRTPLWWARRALNHDVEVLLMECDGQKDVSDVSGEISPKEVSQTWSQRQDADSYCDICYRGLERGEYESTPPRYKCQECNGGDLDVCGECYDAGGRCWDTTGTHCLVRDCKP